MSITIVPQPEVVVEDLKLDLARDLPIRPLIMSEEEFFAWLGTWNSELDADTDTLTPARDGVHNPWFGLYNLYDLL